MKKYQMVVTLKDGSTYKSVPMQEGDDVGEGKVANDEVWNEIRTGFVGMFKGQNVDGAEGHMVVTTKETETEKEEMVCNFMQVDRVVLRSWEEEEMKG